MDEELSLEKQLDQLRGQQVLRSVAHCTAEEGETAPARSDYLYRESAIPRYRCVALSTQRAHQAESALTR